LDIGEEYRQVTIDEGCKKSKDIGENCKFLEISAKNGNNVNETFMSLFDIIIFGESHEEHIKSGKK
jgi:GTPase SAR1 family protein